MLLRGKYLIRKGVSEDGTERLIITGVFEPLDFDIKSINDADELWVSDLLVFPNVIRFSGKRKEELSPEDFLEGECMSPSDWSKREELKI